MMSGKDFVADKALASWMAAFMFAALAPTVVVAGLDRSIKIAPYVFGVALAHAVLLGLPLFLIGRAKALVNLASCLGGGFLVGASPIGVLTWPEWGRHYHSNASIDGVPTIVDGVPTAAGWLNYAEGLLQFGAYGALGGFTLWLVLKWLGAPAPTTDPLNGGARPLSAPISKHRQTVAAAVSVMLAIGIFAIPSITKDRSCHNMFRDGDRTSIGPEENIELQLDEYRWPELRKLLADFGAAHNLSIRDSSETRPGVVEILGVSLCNDSGINILAVKQHWEPRGLESIPPSPEGVNISIYELRPGSGWEQVAKDLVSSMSEKWPGKVRAAEGRPGDSTLLEHP
jgi:hypothetical protein